MEKRITFSVLGMGHIGKRYAEMISRNQECELVAMVDTKPKAKLAIENYDVPFYSSLHDLLQSDIQCDVVCIATPNGLHATHALQCLDAEKHIIIEKPLALSKKDAENVIHTALNAHKHVFPVMQNRYSPPSIWLKELVNSGILGQTYMVELNCYWNRDSRYYKAGTWHGSKDLDGGTLFTQFSHFIDILYWVFGDIKNIQSRLMNFNHSGLTEFEDSGMVNFELVNGGMGCLNYSTSIWDRNLESSMTVISENGSLKIGGQYMEKVEYCHIKNYTMPELTLTNPGNDYGTYKGSAANHHYLIENVVDVLKGRDSINTDALDGLKVVEIIERIYQNK